MNRPKPVEIIVPETNNVWEKALEHRSNIQQMFSEQDKLKAAGEDLRKKISAHLSSINQKR